MKGDNGNCLSWNNNDSDDDSYETPLETVNTDSETEYDDNPNAQEISEDKIENDAELEEFMNNPANDTAMELSKMLNFPDLLDIKTNQESSDSDEEKLEGKLHQLSHSCQKRSRSHSPRCYSGSGWTYTPLRDVRLPQLYQPPESLSWGLCIPRPPGTEMVFC